MLIEDVELFFVCFCFCMYWFSRYILFGVGGSFKVVVFYMNVNFSGFRVGIFMECVFYLVFLGYDCVCLKSLIFSVSWM